MYNCNNLHISLEVSKMKCKHETYRKCDTFHDYNKLWICDNCNVIVGRCGYERVSDILKELERMKHEMQT